MRLLIIFIRELIIIGAGPPSQPSLSLSRQSPTSAASRTDCIAKSTASALDRVYLRKRTEGRGCWMQWMRRLCLRHLLKHTWNRLKVIVNTIGERIASRKRTTVLPIPISNSNLFWFHLFGTGLRSTTTRWSRAPLALERSYRTRCTCPRTWHSES